MLPPLPASVPGSRPNGFSPSTAPADARRLRGLVPPAGGLLRPLLVPRRAAVRARLLALVATGFPWRPPCPPATTAAAPPPQAPDALARAHCCRRAVSSPPAPAGCSRRSPPLPASIFSGCRRRRPRPPAAAFAAGWFAAATGAAHISVEGHPRKFGSLTRRCQAEGRGRQPRSVMKLLLRLNAAHPAYRGALRHCLNSTPITCTC